MIGSGPRVLLIGLGLSALFLAVRVPTLDAPGLYYDEAFLAQQARDFLEPERTIPHPPGTSATWILGGPLPIWNAAYLGSLKSQLLIPAFALFGAELFVVRVATLCTALVAMLLLTLWAHRVLGASISLLTLLLVLFDPSFLFFSAYEWGPYTTLLLCRALGLYLLSAGWSTPGWRGGCLMASGGLAMGLGVYSRADFGVVVFCMALALLAARGTALFGEARERKGVVAAALVGFALGAWPMLVSVAQVLETSASIASRGGLAYKWSVLWSTLDGSNYYRVIREGGLFDSLFALPAPGTVLPFAVLAALPTLGWLLFTSAGRRFRAEDVARGEPQPDAALRFAFFTMLFLAPAMWGVPGAVRAHHMLNLLPIPHLLVASALVAVGRAPRLGRLVAGGVLALLIASDVRLAFETDELIARTGGRGRFSDSTHELAERLDADPTSTAVALDWGFHEPLAFLTDTAALREPIWEIARTLQAGRPWVHTGNAGHVYLVHDTPYDLFQLGPKFLAAVRALPSSDVVLERHDDREGQPAFYSIRFTAAHRLVYTGAFSVHLF